MSGALRDGAGALPGETHEVADGLYAYVQPDGTWWINNTGFLVGRSGVVAIDSCSTEARTRALQEAIRRVSPAPVRTLVNTHHHGDHTHGNYLFGTATIVAHERTRDAVLAEGVPPTSRLIGTGTWEAVEWGSLEVAPPFLTYTDGVTLFVDDLRCEVRHVGTAAHTTNDSVVWVPDRKVLYAGDLLFHGGTPFLVMGSLAGAIEAVEGLRRYGAETIVPGHGPLAGPGLIDEVLGYLRFVERLAAEAWAGGLDPLAAAREADLGGIADLTDSERIVGNLHRAYLELEGRPRGVPLPDPAAVLADMVAFNGGRPLSCRA
ncbi:MAG TPA: MBL fold metallo-hydrolase [Dermatophilaceae bacterium]|nr:MBL fold metallo-hydrolase [Dermatophilaceae bacterium]